MPRREGQEFVVKRKSFSIEQIGVVLKQAELGMTVDDIIQQVGISEQMFYCWKKLSNQVRELKRLQEENVRLRKLVAELSLDKAILQEIASENWCGPR
jgi:putative transposase